MSEKHTNIRDEQFWFTAAIVGFNTVVIDTELFTASPTYAVIASAVLSILGVHLVLTRWLAASGRGKLDRDFNFQESTATQRASYAWAEIRNYCGDLPYVFLEFSGTLLYLLLMLLSFGGVVCRL